VGLARHQVAVGVAALAPVLGELVVGVGAARFTAVVSAHQRPAQHVHVVRRGACEDGLERLHSALRVIPCLCLEDLGDGDDLRFLGRADCLLDLEGLDGRAGQGRRGVTFTCRTRCPLCTSG
ncbi:hypothetical protein RZS08_10040, partial [Arthrospira platensis SPKY1]|nr:hypothetical protein [Arthrospira platensis SPKY1]